MRTEHVIETPKVISYPPLLFWGTFVAGMLLNWGIPSPNFSTESVKVIGVTLGILGTIVAFWGAYAFHRAGTYVRPNRPVTALVTDGPFRYSRNPLYLAMTIIYLGITLYAGALWPLVTLIPALILIHWKIVQREESFLESRFGDDYRVYKAQVRRWL